MTKPIDKSQTELAKEYAERNPEKVIPIKKHIDRDKIKGMSYMNIIESKPVPIENVLTPWLQKQGVVFINAKTGVGKTLFTLNAAYAIAGGGDFLRFSAPLPRKVLYIDGEMAFNQMHRRFMEIVQQQGELDFPENFYLLNPEIILPHHLPKINEPEGQLFYNDFIEEGGYEVIVFDNISTLASIDENRSDDWQPIIDWQLYLRSIGKTLLFVHHAGKGDNEYRGSSRMIDIADTVISLQALTHEKLESEERGDTTFKVSYRKNRNFGGKDALEFHASLTKHGWEFESMEKVNMDMILERLNFKMKQADIALELGVSRQYINKCVRKLIQKGLYVTK